MSRLGFPGLPKVRAVTHHWFPCQQQNFYAAVPFPPTALPGSPCFPMRFFFSVHHVSPRCTNLAGESEQRWGPSVSHFSSSGQRSNKVPQRLPKDGVGVALHSPLTPLSHPDSKPSNFSYSYYVSCKTGKIISRLSSLKSMHPSAGMKW